MILLDYQKTIAADLSGGNFTMEGLLFGFLIIFGISLALRAIILLIRKYNNYVRSKSRQINPGAQSK